MKILFTFAGARDPFNKDGVLADQPTDGPVLSLLGEDHFDRIYIFTDANFLGNAQELAALAKQRHTTKVEIVEVELPDPTDYEAIFYRLNSRGRQILEKHAGDRPEYFIAIASGTPQMQTVWFLLAQSGVIPATLLKVTPRRFLRPGERAVVPIRLSLSEFPKVTPGEIDHLELASLKIQNETLEAERAALFEAIEAEGIIGKSKAIKDALTTLMKVAPTDYPVLLLGERGTGKELFAQAIHQRSKRAAKPFFSVNCPALPGTLVESELFGYEKDAFTGATSARKGKFELAEGGTLFLDEVADLALEAQGKLLRALQNGEIQKLGSARILQVNVRIVAATNKDLQKLSEDGGFRPDVYDRLNVIPIRLPSLRERREDIPPLIEHFVRRAYGRKRLSKKTLRSLTDYSWPGNIRELKNVIERMAVLSEGDVITESDIPSEIAAGTKAGTGNDIDVALPPGGLDLTAYIERLETAYFKKAIELKGGNHAAAARFLNLEPHTFRKRARDKFRL